MDYLNHSYQHIIPYNVLSLNSKIINSLFLLYDYQEMFENSKRDITVAMMKTYPQLLRKFMPDKDKVAPLVGIIPHMNLELYSLKRQEQVNTCIAFLHILICVGLQGMLLLTQQ